MQLIGLTGGIATGKSASSDFLRSQGLPVIDADLLARKVVERGNAGYEKVRESFPEVIMQDGNIDRTALGAIVFKDSRKQKLLECIVHPLVKREMLWLIFTYWVCGYSRVILDIPLLFEVGLDRFTSFTIIIYWYCFLVSTSIQSVVMSRCR
jgi:dephospho-CoA kinase